MPRPSAESLTVVPVAATVDVMRLRLLARDTLPPAVQAVFAELVGSVDPSHFRESDRPVLEELARAIALQREAAGELDAQGLILAGSPNPLIRVVREQARLIASLATKCRLTTQARISKEKAGATGNSGPNLDEALHLARRFADGR